MQIEQEVRRVIPDFPRYEITNYGRVFNIDTGREMVLTRNQAGIVMVGLMTDVDYSIDGHVSHTYEQRTRSVKSLVAREFVQGETDKFNTPIQLDGNRDNLHASNIVWRPRWFAIRYTRQMYNLEDWFYNGPIRDITNDVKYDNYLQAAITNGLLCKDIRRCILNRKAVFPTGDHYRFLNNDNY
jgi:hypothetical protein